MISQKIAQMINTQINKELYSAYLYWDFANYYADESLDGFANWYTVQAQEELAHAQIMRNYLIQNAVRVTFDAIDKPDKKFDDFTAPLKAGYEHEQYVTSLINGIYGAAFEEKDFKTMQFLDWFIKEQGEEEKNAEDMIKKAELFGHDPKTLYLLDQEYAARVYVVPTPLASTAN